MGLVTHKIVLLVAVLAVGVTISAAVNSKYARRGNNHRAPSAHHVAHDVTKVKIQDVKAAKDVTPSSWTDCSKACDTGTRDETSGTGWIIDCNVFSCAFNATCTCGTADLIFIIDTSGSIGEENFWVEKQFLLDVVNGLYRVGPESTGTRIACVSFGDFAVVEFDFDAGYGLHDMTTLNNAIWGLPYRGGSTNSADGLRTATTIMVNQGNPNTKRMAIYLSDGSSNINDHDTIPAANDLKDQGVFVYAIGVGNVAAAEMQGIASEPTDLFYFHVNSYADLESIIESVLNGSCCYSSEPTCTYSESGACSSSCGGGINWRAQVCVYYDYYGNVIKNVTYNVTEACCEIPCPPTYEDCDKCNFTDGVGYLQDPANCHCFYQCEILSPGNYRHFHMCCADTLYFLPSIDSCYYVEPVAGCIIPPYENCETNPWNTPAPDGTVPPSTTTPCPYTQNPDNPAEYMLGGAVIGTCASGLIWDVVECTCIVSGTAIPCQEEALLHFPFDEHMNDVSCLGAVSEKHGTPVLTPNGIKGNAVRFNSSFLTVPAMNNYLAGRKVSAWSVSVWLYRDGPTNEYMGLVNNGDCVSDPSWTLRASSLNQATCGVVTYNTATMNPPLVLLDYVPVDYQRWTMVTMVYDGVVNQDLRFYVNGNLQPNSKPVTGTLVNRQCPMAIGIEGTDGYPGIYAGYMDELLVYERALSASEVMALYTNP